MKCIRYTWKACRGNVFVYSQNNDLDIDEKMMRFDTFALISVVFCCNDLKAKKLSIFSWEIPPKNIFECDIH